MAAATDPLTPRARTLARRSREAEAAAVRILPYQLAPAVAMAAHGTIDQRTRAAWRALPAQRAASPPVVVIPEPRRGVDDCVPA